MVDLINKCWVTYRQILIIKYFYTGGIYLDHHSFQFLEYVRCMCTVLCEIVLPVLVPVKNGFEPLDDVPVY